MTKKLRPVPQFRTEAEERVFWESHDSADYVDQNRAERARFPNLKLSTASISLRLNARAEITRINVSSDLSVKLTCNRRPSTVRP